MGQGLTSDNYFAMNGKFQPNIERCPTGGNSAEVSARDLVDQRRSLEEAMSDNRIDDDLTEQIKQQQEYIAMVEQVEKLQQKLNQSKNQNDMESSLNKIFDEERLHTGHFNSKVNAEERQCDEIYKVGRRNSYQSVNMDPIVEN